MSDTQIKDKINTNHTVKEPNHYEIIMHNDDFTPMDFVVMILQEIFHKEKANAEKIMMDVHKNGSAKIGTYSYDIAKTKVEQCTSLARQKNYPFRVSLHQV